MNADMCFAMLALLHKVHAEWGVTVCSAALACASAARQLHARHALPVLHGSHALLLSIVDGRDSRAACK